MEEYRAVLHVCGEKTPKAKAQLGVKLNSVVLDDKNGSLMYVNSRRMPKEVTDLILLLDANLADRD